jgi:hypothetical protein
MHHPIDIPETEDEVATLKRLIQEAIDEMKAARITILAGRREIARLREETRVLREETETNLAELRSSLFQVVTHG